MVREGSRPDNRTKPKTRTAPRTRKDSNAAKKLLRLVLTTVIAVVLAVVFIKMVIPDRETVSPGPDRDKPVVPKPTAEGIIEASGEGTSDIPGDEGKTTRTYRGQGGEPVDDPTFTWEITLTLSGQSLQLLEGTVVTTEIAGEPPKSEFSFSITPDHYRKTLSESGDTTLSVDNSYDPMSSALFSINEKNQFFVYVTPKKLSLAKDAIPPRILTEGENSPLIYMQGFIRPDDTVVGTLRSIFGPGIEYVLEPLIAD